MGAEPQLRLVEAEVACFLPPYDFSSESSEEALAFLLPSTVQLVETLHATSLHVHLDCIAS